MTDLILCCFPGACSRATMIALEEAGAPYQPRLVDLRTGGQKAPDYLSINQKGKVPALIIDGVPLTENIAILSYLAESFPDAKLLPPPADALGRAQALSAVAWLSSGVLPLLSRIMRPASVCDLDGSAERVASIAKSDIRANLAIADAHMRDREWWVDQWSVADAYLFYIESAVERLEIALDAFPALVAHKARMERRPATQRAMTWEQKALAPTR